MLSYIAKRLILLIPLLLGITLISFVVIHLAPGEPTDLQTQMNPQASSELQERLRVQYGLDQPLYIQYGKWLSQLVRLDFGESFATDRRPVLDKVLERLPITILLNLLSIGLILAVSIPLGIISAVRRNSGFDRTTTILVFTGFAMPSFWLALLMMDWFGVRLGWLPVSGLKSLGYEYLSWGDQLIDRASHLVLPVFISAIGGLAGFSRYMRSNMLEVIRHDYILTARAKGLSERVVIYKHALRNALLPVYPQAGPDPYIFHPKKTMSLLFY
jgi:peptide/nickel transport system permease protein